MQGLRVGLEGRMREVPGLGVGLEGPMLGLGVRSWSRVTGYNVRARGQGLE